jgi:glycerol kinase
LAKYVAAIDQGTSSTRFMIFDRFGTVISSDQREHRQIYPKPGWVEHDPTEIWDRTREVVSAALQKADLKPSDLAAVGITNQRETTLVWNRQTGQPYGNAIVWQDTRTDGLINELAQTGGQDRFRIKTGLPLATYFSGPKLRWMLDNTPGLRQAVANGDAIFGNIDSWLLWNLSGGLHITDVTNASRTQLMNLENLSWDADLLSALDIPSELLPSIQPSSKIYALGQGVLEGVPLAGDLGDQQAALFGQTCFNPGEVKNTYGTGCFMLMNTGTAPTQSHSGLLTTLGYQIEGDLPVYCLEGSIAIAGALVQWLRDNLHMISASPEIETLAQSVSDSGGIYIVPAFSGLFAPHWRSDARGIIVGLTRYINSGHIARAVLEATAYQTYEVIEAMEKDSGVSLSSLKVDGGMVYNNLLMQFQSDLLDVPVVRPKVAETTALGAAYAAGLAVGFWNSLDELRANWGQDKCWRPNMETTQRVKLVAGWKKAVERTLNWMDS